MNTVERIKKLTSILNYARNEYYNNSNSEITDSEYDRLFDELSQLEKETGMILSNSPTQTVGYGVVSKLEKVKHNHPMLSLDKTKSVDDIVNFLGDKDGIAMLKMDGLTCSTGYNEYLTSAETRGNGEEGEDVLSNAKTITNLPLHISLEDTLIVDGEVIIDYDSFNKINENLSDDEKYKNPRNLASGSIRQLDSSIAAKRNMKFIAWKVISGINSNNHSTRLNELEELGFTVVPFVTIYNLKSRHLMEEKIEDAITKLKQMAIQLHYPIDGIVFGYDDIAYGESLGMTGHHLKSQIAYKFYDDTVQSKMKHIDWTMGKTGVLTPTAVFEPCEIEGSTVERASLHNVSIFKEMCPTVGCTANVYKANCIIPQVKSFEEDGVSQIDVYPIPKVCPICRGETKIVKDNDTEVLMCTNDNCKGKLLGRLSHFVSKPAMNIDGLAEAQLSQFIKLGWLTKLVDIYSLPMRKEIMTLDGFGKRSFEKLVSAIEASRNTTLQRVIYSLSIPNVGKDASKKISQKCCGELEAFKYLINTKYDWSELDGIGSVINQSIYDYFTAANKIDFIELLERLEITSDNSSNTNSNSKSLEGFTFVITGSVKHYKNRDELKAEIESRNGKVSGSVSAKTNYLINNDNLSTSGKNKKAKELNIPIITENQFLEMIK